MFTFIFKRISSCIEIFQAAVLCTSSREHPYCNSKAAWSRVLCFGSWEPHLQQSTITWSHQGLLSGFTLRGWKKAANGKTDDGRQPCSQRWIRWIKNQSSQNRRLFCSNKCLLRHFAEQQVYKVQLVVKVTLKI